VLVAGFAIAPAVAPEAAAPPPSIAQICAATGIEEVDALLDGVARSALVGTLQPLASVTVPNRDTVEIDASVQLADVKKALNCAAAPIAAPTAANPTPPRDRFSQLDEIPTLAAQTGGGPEE